MAHSLATATATTPFSTISNANRISSAAVIIRASHQRPPNAAPSHYDNKIVNRRSLSLSLLNGALFVGLKGGGEQSAKAAGRRPPPPPPEDKKDPNVSGVQAKVLASKRRKEAMKEQMEKLRQKGKPIQQEAPPPPPPSSE